VGGGQQPPFGAAGGEAAALEAVGAAQILVWAKMGSMIAWRRR
jgi:hypothetical protein